MATQNLTSAEQKVLEDFRNNETAQLEANTQLAEGKINKLYSDWADKVQRDKKTAQAKVDRFNVLHNQLGGDWKIQIGEQKRTHKIYIDLYFGYKEPSPVDQILAKENGHDLYELKKEYDAQIELGKKSYELDSSVRIDIEDKEYTVKTSKITMASKHIKDKVYTIEIHDDGFKVDGCGSTWDQRKAKRAKKLNERVVDHENSIQWKQEQAVKKDTLKERALKSAKGKFTDISFKIEMTTKTSSYGRGRDYRSYDTDVVRVYLHNDIIISYTFRDIDGEIKFDKTGVEFPNDFDWVEGAEELGAINTKIA